MIEILCIKFLSTFAIELDVKNERKRASRMCENVNLIIQNQKVSKAHFRLQIAFFTCVTPLCYIDNFQPQTLGPHWQNPESAPTSF